jgi:hypothetical protein
VKKNPAKNSMDGWARGVAAMRPAGKRRIRSLEPPSFPTVKPAL